MCALPKKAKGGLDPLALELQMIVEPRSKILVLWKNSQGPEPLTHLSSSSDFLRQSLPLNLELTVLPRLTEQQARGVLLGLQAYATVPGFCIGLGI